MYYGSIKWVSSTIVIWGTCIISAYIFMKIWVIIKNISIFKNFFFNMLIGYIIGILLSNIILEVIFLMIYKHIYMYYPHILSINDQSDHAQMIFIKLLGLDIRGILVLIVDYLTSIVTYWLYKRNFKESDKGRFS